MLAVKTTCKDRWRQILNEAQRIKPKHLLTLQEGVSHRQFDEMQESKNLVLFLSSITKNSRALREEVDYGINIQGLPVIVVYPDFSEKSDIIICDSKQVRTQIKNLWGKLATFRDSMKTVPTLHVPNKKDLIRKALGEKDLQVQTKGEPGVFFYPC